MTSVNDAPAGWHCLVHSNPAVPAVVSIGDGFAGLCEDCYRDIRSFERADLPYQVAVAINDYQIKSYWITCKSIPRWQFYTLEAANVVADALNEYAKRLRIEGMMWDWEQYCD